MGRPKISDGTPLAIRLDAKTRERLEALQTTLVPGLEVTLAQVVRAALTRGLDAMDLALARQAAEFVADASPLLREARESAADSGGLHATQGQAGRAMKKRRPRA